MKRLLPLLVVIFLAYLGYSLTLPIFPSLFFTQETHFLPLTTSEHARKILLGLLFTMFPLGQFIGAPIIGQLSDKYGRKTVLLFSLLATIPTYIGSAISVTYNLPWVLYLSYLLTGLLEGNITIAQAAIADISKDKHSKLQNFGWMVSLSSTAFFFGPLLGGRLSHWFGYDVPFWFGAFLVAAGFLVVWKLFEDTHPGHSKIEIHPIKVLFSVFEGLKIKQVKEIFLANCTFFLGIFFFINFFSAYLSTKWQFNVALLGDANAYLSLFVIIAPCFFKLLARFFSERTTFRIGTGCLGMSLLAFLAFSSPISLIFTLIPIGIFIAIGFSYPSLLISHAVDQTKQGKALGTNVSIQVFAEGITAALGGFLMTFFNGLPILVGAFCAILGIFLLKKKNRQKPQMDVEHPTNRLV